MGARAANDRFGAQITHPSGCDERPVLELSIHFRMWIFVSTIIHRENIMIDPTGLITYSLIVLGFVFISAPATLLTVGRATTSEAKVGIATGAGISRQLTPDDHGSRWHLGDHCGIGHALHYREIPWRRLSGLSRFEGDTQKGFG